MMGPWLFHGDGLRLSSQARAAYSTTEALTPLTNTAYFKASNPRQIIPAMSFRLCCRNVS